jgi:hypothetical protein
VPKLAHCRCVARSRDLQSKLLITLCDFKAEGFVVPHAGGVCERERERERDREREGGREGGRES